MKLSEGQYLEHCESNDGYCPTCDAIEDGDFFEPDASNRHCDECGESKAMGIEFALICGHIQIVSGD